MDFVWMFQTARTIKTGKGQAAKEGMAGLSFGVKLLFVLGWGAYVYP